MRAARLSRAGFVALRESDVPTYPVIDSISYDGGLAHGPVPTFSASRSAPSRKRLTVVWVPQLCSRISADFRSGALMSSSGAACFAMCCNAKRTTAQGRVGPCFANS
jgi:hypothetical protein